MNKFEKKIIIWLEKNSIELGIVAIFILGFVARYILRTYVSGDASSFLLPWYDAIKENGGIKSLQQQVGDYNVLYQFFIALFTYLPLEPLTDYKLLSGIFDILLAGIGGAIIWNITGKNRKKTFAVIACVFLSPIVLLNSSCWGQCDSIYTFFCVLTLYLLMKEKYSMALCMYGIAFSFKLQALFFLPFLLLYYVRKKEFSITKFLYLPIMMILTGVPALLQGRKVSEIFGIYGNQVNEYSGNLVMNYPNFWNFLYNIDLPQYAGILSGVAIIFTIGILLFIVIWTVKNDIQMTKYNCVWLAFLITYTCVLFLPSMHDRYGYLCEILALLIVVADKKTIVLCVPMYLCSLFVYGRYLFGVEYNTRYLTVINVITFIGYCVYFEKIQKKAIRKFE